VEACSWKSLTAFTIILSLHSVKTINVRFPKVAMSLSEFCYSLFHVDYKICPDVISYCMSLLKLHKTTYIGRYYDVLHFFLSTLTSKIGLVIPTNVQNNTPSPRHQHACLVVKSFRSFSPTNTATTTTGIPKVEHVITAFVKVCLGNALIQYC
jgi:hypothetical protein